MRWHGERIGVLGLYVFSFGIWFHKGLSKGGIALMLMGLVLAWKRRPDLGRSPVIWVTGLWLAYLFARTLASLAEGMAPLHWEEGLRMAWVAGFLLVAWHLEGREDRILRVLGLAGAGFFLGRLLHLDEVLAAKWDFWHHRYELGFPTAIPFGQYSAAVALGLMVLGHRLWQEGEGRFWMVPLWVMGLSMALECVLLSQSRSVWGAFLLAGVVVGVMGWRCAALSRRALILTVGLTLALATGIGITQSKVVVDRFQTEKEVYAQLLGGALDEVPMEQGNGQEYSVGVRVAMWRFGLDRWLERPWFGWGPGATKQLIACCAPSVFKRFNDLHNVYVEILVRLGGVGFMLTVAMAGAVVVSGWRGWLERKLAADLFVLVIGALLLDALVAAFNFRLLNYDWRFYWFLFGGMAASFGFRRCDEVQADC